MVVLDRCKAERIVGGFYGRCAIFLPAHHRADCINVLNHDICFLVDCLEEAEIGFAGIDRLFKDTVLVQIRSLSSQIHGELLELCRAPDTCSFFDQT